MEHKVRRLPDSELEIMQIIWELEPPIARRDIEEKLYDLHPMALTTLLTLLTRLMDKGFISAEKAGRSSVYRPLIARQDYLADQSNRFFQKICGGDLSAFASALCHSGLSREELDELRRLLEENKL